jgi:hypothetical protein
LHRDSAGVHFCGTSGAEGEESLANGRRKEVEAEFLDLRAFVDSIRYVVFFERYERQHFLRRLG